MRRMLAAAVVLAAVVTSMAEPALPCDPQQCQAPDCRCSSTDTPGGFAVDEIPHFVVLSFDDGVTVTNHPFYDELTNKKNPNGCNIQMTFFVSHDNTDYTLVNDLHRKHHEIAVHSVTHKNDVENYWRKLDKQGWMDEIQDQRTMLELYGNIPPEDVTGFRAPFLEVGGDPMYEALKESGFQYDCSWPSLQFTPWFEGVDGTINGTLWPYTLDYKSNQDKTVGQPPTESIPGLYVAPMADLQDNRGVECAMLDACESADDELETSAAAVTDLLKRNFKAHYNTRTPFGAYIHHSWFYLDDINGNTVRKDGFQGFLDYLSAFPEVYIVTAKQLVEWTKNPKKLSELDDLPAFQCKSNLLPNDCLSEDHVNCHYSESLPISSTEVYMNICQKPCPASYPYLGNTGGAK